MVTPEQRRQAYFDWFNTAGQRAASDPSTNYHTPWWAVGYDPSKAQPFFNSAPWQGPQNQLNVPPAGQPAASKTVMPAEWSRPPQGYDPTGGIGTPAATPTPMPAAPVPMPQPRPAAAPQAPGASMSLAPPFPGAQAARAQAAPTATGGSGAWANSDGYRYADILPNFGRDLLGSTNGPSLVSKALEWLHSNGLGSNSNNGNVGPLY